MFKFCLQVSLIPIDWYLLRHLTTFFMHKN